LAHYPVGRADLTNKNRQFSRLLGFINLARRPAQVQQ
jgi:hypothetical protein